MTVTFPAIDSGFIISFQQGYFKFSLSHCNIVSFKSWNSLYLFFSLCYSCSLPCILFFTVTESTPTWNIELLCQCSSVLGLSTSHLHLGVYSTHQSLHCIKSCPLDAGTQASRAGRPLRALQCRVTFHKKNVRRCF